MDKTTADALIGTTIAQYEVVARLGGGGMGIVYSARDTRLGRRVALKFLPPRWSHDDSAKQRFIREAQAASATDHRNICTIHDIETAADGQLFIVMAHYDGPTLKQRLEAGPLPVDDAVEIAAQVAEGLAKAHAQGVIHRDIKPGNLILTEDGVKILDFGLAKLAAESLRLTLEGTTIGTVAYMSPEQARGDEADPRSDVWALGIVLYEMLAGQPPFRGHYAEAISHAIRHDTPAPMRTAGRDVPEALERLVVHALKKNPDERVQSARDLARELRLLQGRTLPLDLRTEPLTAPLPGAAGAGHAARASTARDPSFWTLPKTIGAAVAVVALLVGAPLWLFAPMEPMPVAVAPVMNQTGYAELDPYRLALTHALIDQVAGASAVSVMPYERLLEIVRPFTAPGSDVSSRDAIQRLTASSGARIVVVPTLLNENGGWKARVEFRDASTATTTARYETPVVVSSLMKDTVYGLMPPLAAGIQDHFTATGPWRVSFANTLFAWTGRGPRASAPRLGNLDAAHAFAQAIDAYEQQEYPAALQAFVSASSADPRNAIPLAWRSHVATLIRNDDEAVDAARQARALLGPQTRTFDQQFVEAVDAEARRDFSSADARYRELASAAPNTAAWLVELGAYEERRTRFAAAVESHVAALAGDSRLLRPRLELCRLYGPNRLNEGAKAREHGRAALTGYTAIGDRNGQAHALLCLADVLRTGAAQDREEAGRQAQEALQMLTEVGSTYNLPRAQYYVGLTTAIRGSMGGAAAWWEKAVASARTSGNRVLEPLLLMNLGVANMRLGNRLRATEYYEASSKLYETLGDEVRAAQQQANGAALRIEYSDDPAGGLRDLQNALAVFQKLGDKNFEVFCLQVIAAYYRQTGRHTDAERELNRALAVARERDLQDDAVSLTIDLARSQIEAGAYAAARARLIEVLGDGRGPFSTAARIHLGRARAAAGDAGTADADFNAARTEIENGADSELVPLLHVASGQVAYEYGRTAEGRAHFSRAAIGGGEELPDAASIEARAYLGLLDALDGRTAAGRTALNTSLAQARARGRVALEAKCGTMLAEIELRARRWSDALRALDNIPADDASRTIGPELRAQVHGLRARAMTGLRDEAGAAAEIANARRTIERLRAALPEGDRDRFAARPGVRRLLQ